MTDRTFRRPDEEGQSNVPEHVRKMMEGHEDAQMSPFPTRDLISGKVRKTLPSLLDEEPKSEQSE